MNGLFILLTALGTKDPFMYPKDTLNKEKKHKKDKSSV